MPEICFYVLLPGSVPPASSSSENLVTPKQLGSVESPQSTEKMPAPSKLALLQALNQQQQLLEKLLAAKHQRAKSASPGPLYADGDR